MCKSSGQYDYWLQQHDIPDIARVHYRYQVGELEVVGSNEQLSRVLENYRSSKHTHPFTIILNIGENGNRGSHWVSMVLHRVNNEYHAYYTDSFGQEICGSTATIMNNNNILIHNVGMVQQSDGYNCGLWALENAVAIRNVITKPNYNINIQDILNNLPQHSAETLNSLRRDISSQLSRDDQRLTLLLDMGVDLREIETIPEVYRDNFATDQAAAALLGCLASYSVTSSKSKRSIGKVPIITSDRLVDSKWFMHCTDKLSTDVFMSYLISVLSKLRLKDDNHCDKVEQFILEQKVIDDLKKEIPDMHFNLHLMMKKTSALITKALETHDIDLFRVVCKRYGNEFNQVVDGDGRTLLHKVMHYADAKQWADLLIGENISIDIKDTEGNTALYYAILNDHAQVVDVLIRKGANVDSVNKEGNSLLLYSIMHSVNNNFAIPKLLIEKGANINILNNNNTALYLSVLKNDTSIVEFLLDRKANVNIHNNGNDTALNAAIRMNNTIMTDLLLTHEANVSAPGHQGNTTLIIATAMKNKDLVNKLIENGADVNDKNDDGYSAISIIVGGAAVAAVVLGIIAFPSVGSGAVLSWIGGTVAAAAVGSWVSGIVNRAGGYSLIEGIDSSILESLTNHGAELNVVNNFGSTPLHDATQSHNYEMIEFSLDHGARIDAVNSDGNTALHISTNQLRYRGRGRSTREIDDSDDNVVKKIIHLLIEKDAKVDIKNQYNQTAIYLAVIKENKEIIELYLNHVKDSTILLDRAYNDNKSVLEHALENKDSEIISKFIHFQDTQGKSILHASVLKGDKVAINLLLKHKININIQDTDGNTALHLAQDLGDHEMMRYLQHGADIELKNNMGVFALQEKFVLNYNADVNLKNNEHRPLWRYCRR